MKAKQLLLVSALSLLPLTSMGADAPKAPNPATGAVTGATQKGTVASTTPSPPQLNHSTVSSSAPGSPGMSNTIVVSGELATATPPSMNGPVTVTTPAPSGSFGGGIQNKK